MTLTMDDLKDKLVEVRNAGGMEAVDHYLDANYRLIPWEQCYECDCITPRNPLTLRCFFEEEYHDE